MGIARLVFGWSGSKKYFRKKKNNWWISRKKCGFKMRSHLPRPLIFWTHK